MGDRTFSTFSISPITFSNGNVGTSDAWKGNLQSLETLRIIAALLVVCAHIPPYDIPFIGWFFGANRFLGSIGVDLFFVISGVVIGLSTLRAISQTSRPPLRSFLIARGFRIFPLYWLITVVTVILQVRRGAAFPTLDQLAHSLLLIPREGVDGYVDPIVAIGWTLQFEVFFYVLCALGIATRQRWLPMIAAIVLATASIAFNGYYLDLILLEFAAGYALALYLTAQSYSWTPVGPLASSLLITAATALFLLAATGRDGDYPAAIDAMRAPRMMISFGEMHVPRGLAWGIPAVFAVAIALRLETSLRWRLALLGKYTYSVYLCHTFAIGAALGVGRRLGHEQWMVAALPVFIVLIAGLVYRAIELPMIRAGKRLDAHLRRPVAAP